MAKIRTERQMRRKERKIRWAAKKEELKTRWKNSKFRTWLKGRNWGELGKGVGLLLLKKIQQKNK